MELSEEEKEAINFIKEVIEFWLDEDKSYVFGTDYEKENLKIILNLIEKQQKEIKKEHQNWKELLHEYGTKVEEITNDYISKDKIREKIKHYNNELEHIKNGEEFENEEPMYYWGKVALENLLEED